MLSDFAGVWQRTLFFDPHNAAEPHAQSSDLVFWLQSRSGLFVDLRRPPLATDSGDLTFKSFAGIGSVVATSTPEGQRCEFTWTRMIDFRPRGPPDVGTVSWLGPSLLQEDSILPADDYREIWQRISPPEAVTLEVLLECLDTARPDAMGVLVLSGGYLAYATQNRSSCNASDGVVHFFASSASVTASPSPEVTDWLQGFFSVLAKDGLILSCSKSSLVGRPIASISALHLRNWRASTKRGSSVLSPPECEQVNAALSYCLL